MITFFQFFKPYKFRINQINSDLKKLNTEYDEHILIIDAIYDKFCIKYKEYKDSNHGKKTLLLRQCYDIVEEGFKAEKEISCTYIQINYLQFVAEKIYHDYYNPIGRIGAFFLGSTVVGIIIGQLLEFFFNLDKYKAEDVLPIFILLIILTLFIINYLYSMKEVDDQIIYQKYNTGSYKNGIDTKITEFILKRETAITIYKKILSEEFLGDYYSLSEKLSLYRYRYMGRNRFPFDYDDEEQTRKEENERIRENMGEDQEDEDEYYN